MKEAKELAIGQHTERDKELVFYHEQGQLPFTFINGQKVSLTELIDRKMIYISAIKHRTVHDLTLRYRYLPMRVILTRHFLKLWNRGIVNTFQKQQHIELPFTIWWDGFPVLRTGCIQLLVHIIPDKKIFSFNTLDDELFISLQFMSMISWEKETIENINLLARYQIEDFMDCAISFKVNEESNISFSFVPHVKTQDKKLGRLEVGNQISGH
jgi:hypothetical protein